MEELGAGGVGRQNEKQLGDYQSNLHSTMEVQSWRFLLDKGTTQKTRASVLLQLEIPLLSPSVTKNT